MLTFEPLAFTRLTSYHVAGEWRSRLWAHTWRGCSAPKHPSRLYQVWSSRLHWRRFINPLNHERYVCLHRYWLLDASGPFWKQIKQHYNCLLNFTFSDLRLLLSLATIPKVIKRSFAVSYGTPVGVGMLVGVVWGINKMVGHVEHLVYDMPTSPLTHVYRKKLYVALDLLLAR